MSRSRKHLPGTFLVELLDLHPGIQNLIERYGRACEKGRFNNEVNRTSACLSLLHNCLTKKEKKDIAKIKKENPLSPGFLCGTCGFSGELILVYGTQENMIKRWFPGSVSVESIVEILKWDFAGDVRVTKLAQM